MFAHAFLIQALIGAVLSALSLALFSPWVTLRRISYMGEALSHIAFAGIAIALLAGLAITPVTLVFVVAIALAIPRISRFRGLEEANTITIFLSVSMALGIILVSIRKGYTFDLAGYLFGNILLVDSSGLWQLAALLAVNLAFCLIFFKELFYMSYNPAMAEFFGIRARLVDALFMALLAVNIVLNVRSAGIILVTAQLILPAATAFNLARRIIPAVFLCVGIALVAALGGFALSWSFDLPTGACIVLAEFVLFLLSLLAPSRMRN
jgi:zinc transport system permease protein